MPFKKTYRKRKYYKRRRFYKKKRYKYMAYKGYKLGLKAMRRLNVEYKHYDTVISTTPTWSGTINTLNDIPQGDANGTRDGDRLKMTSLTMRATFDAGTAGVLRLILLLDKQRLINGVTDYLEASEVGTINAPNASKDEGNFFRSKTIYDRRVCLSDSGPEVTAIKKLFKFNIPVQFDAGTTTVTTNRLQFIMISDAAVGPISAHLVFRLSYIDN